MRLTDHQGNLRHLASLLLLVGLFECLAGPAAAADPLAKVRPMFDEHCYDCHDADAKKGGLDLEALKWKLDDAETLQQWTKVFDKVARGEMPPKDKKRPKGELSSTFLKSLGGDLHDFTLGAQQRDGRVVYRRLNRTEYEHTLHDLLGIDTALRDLLPEDGTLDGFDNVGSALNLSAVHLERYMQAADLALKEAISTGPRPVTTKIRTDYEETWKDWGPIGFPAFSGHVRRRACLPFGRTEAPRRMADCWHGGRRCRALVTASAFERSRSSTATACILAVPTRLRRTGG